MFDQYYRCIIIAPLLAVVLNFLLLLFNGKMIYHIAITLVCSLTSFIGTLFVFNDVMAVDALYIYDWSWVTGENFKIQISFYIDSLSWVYTLLVTGIGSMMTLYFIDQRRREGVDGRFFVFYSSLLLTTVMLVLAENFLVFLIAWQLLTLASYFLIIDERSTANSPSIRGNYFYFHRVGDLLILLGGIGLATILKDTSLIEIKTVSADFIASNRSSLSVSVLLTVLGVVFKSSHFPFGIWISKLHTNKAEFYTFMLSVAALVPGVLLLARLSFILQGLPEVSEVVLWLGLMSALLASLISLTQTRINKIIAFLAITQFGYILVAYGVNAYYVGVLHAVNVIFILLILTLGAEFIRYYFCGEDNIWKMGSLYNDMPKMFWCYIVALLSFCGIPGFSCFFSYVQLLWAVFNKPGSGYYIWGITLFSMIITMLCITKVVLLVFLAERNDTVKVESGKLERTSLLSIVPLIAISILGILVGYIGLPEILTEEYSNIFAGFIGKHIPLSPSLQESSNTEYLLVVILVIAAVFSIVISYLLYIDNEKDKLVGRLQKKVLPLWNTLHNELYFDRIINLVIYRISYKIARRTGNYFEDIIEGFFQIMSLFFHKLSILLQQLRVRDLEANILITILGITVMTIVLTGSFLFH